LGKDFLCVGGEDLKKEKLWKIQDWKDGNFKILSVVRG
jgi:hypothetical protein